MSIWVVEVSPQRQSSHIDTLAKQVAINEEMIREDVIPEYFIIYVCGSQDEAHAWWLYNKHFYLKERGV